MSVNVYVFVCALLHQLRCFSIVCVGVRHRSVEYLSWLKPRVECTSSSAQPNVPPHAFSGAGGGILRGFRLI